MKIIEIDDFQPAIDWIWKDFPQPFSYEGLIEFLNVENTTSSNILRYANSFPDN